jgi:hypothetical protein
LTPPAAIGTLTIDLTNGFIVYIQVCARGIALSTKTTVAVYGPHFAGWGDNTKAVAGIPSAWFSYKCAPVELAIGTSNGVTACDGTAYATHHFAIPNYTFLTAATNLVLPTQGSGTTFARGHLRDKFQNLSGVGTTVGSSTTNPVLAAYGSNIFTGANAVGNDFQIHRLSTFDAITDYYVYGTPQTNVRGIVPSIHLDDWYKWVGTATDESLVLVADTVLTTAASADIAIDATSVSVSSTTGFASAGFIVIESEILQYTGLSGGNTFTGVTRGVYGTIATAHWTGDAVAQGGWFVKINGGALFAGYVKPT